MKTLYLECNMGAAGDMLMAALLELLPDKQAFINRMNGFNLPGVNIVAEPSVKCGIRGTHIAVTVHGAEEVDNGAPPPHEHDHKHLHEHDEVHDHHHDHEFEHDHHHEHSGMDEISHMIGQLALPEKVREDALAVYRLLAEAESFVHGKPVEHVHFHEVGTMDAVADIVGVCLLMHELAPERVLASPIHVGSGQVRCTHGILPVPAPATAHLLRGVPTYGGAVRGELCTPTGAALLKHFVEEFGAMPVMSVNQIGYGMGKKDFEAANCVRALLGETANSGEEIAELCCNLDDMTPEAIGFAMEQLFACGALDVYTAPIGMKKSRPGILLSCMCHLDKREDMIRLIFKHTTTLGIREYICNRYTLHRSERSIQTQYGAVRVKEASGWGVRREKVEYEDAAKIAREKGCSLFDAAKLPD